MESKLMKYLCTTIGTDDLLSNPDISLFKSGLLSSIDLIELIVYLEEECGVPNISPSSIDRDEFDTPRQIIKFVNNLTS